MDNQPEMVTSNAPEGRNTGITKVATHIEGLDRILHGGLPAGRATLLRGGPGTGKTVLGLEFLYRGALAGEPGIFVSFEETPENIRRSALAFGWDLAALEAQEKLFLIDGQIDQEAMVSGEFNFKGFLAIIEGKVRAMEAKRVVIDALDMLMSFFNETHKELQQILLLNRWLAEKKITAILTEKKLLGGDGEVHQYLDFLADCLIDLDQRLVDQVSTRRLRVTKYRGSGYSSNESPFLITDTGVFVYAISDLVLEYKASYNRLPSGNSMFDTILGGGGYKEGSCILITGQTGTGKTALASTFAVSTCEKERKVLYVNYEESPDTMMTDMLSLGIDLRPAAENGSLYIMSIIPEAMGIEEHFYFTVKAIDRFQPGVFILDAISAGARIAGKKASFDFLMRVIHYCRKRQITVLLINQQEWNNQDFEVSGIGISSIIDTIIALNYENVADETCRNLKVIKSRGAKHSRRCLRFFLTEQGFRIAAETGQEE